MTKEMKNMQARIPAEMHIWLKMEALRQGMTLSDLVYKVLCDYRATKESK